MSLWQKFAAAEKTFVGSIARYYTGKIFRLKKLPHWKIRGISGQFSGALGAVAGPVSAFLRPDFGAVSAGMGKRSNGGRAVLLGALVASAMRRKRGGPHKSGALVASR